MYRPKKNRPNKIFWIIAGGILGAHLIALAIFGGIVLFSPPEPDGDPFEEPPIAEKIDPVQIEFKRNLQEKQKKTQRPKQKLQVQTVNNLAMPDVDIQVPSLSNNADIGRVGGGFGDLGGAELGVGDMSVSLFDVKATGEKFLFAIDVNRDLLQDSKGGIPTYDVIKEDILEVISGLPSGVLFNVILFDRERMEAWRPEMEPATRNNKESVEKWLAPVNASAGSVGIRRQNFRPKAWEIPLIADGLSTASGYHGNYITMVTAGLLEQQPDGIFILSDGLPGFSDARMKTEEDRRKEKEAFMEKIDDLGFDTEVEYRKARAATHSELMRRVREFKAEENKKRAKKGLPPRVYTWGETRKLQSEIEADLKREMDDYVPVIRVHEITEVDEDEIEDLYERLLRMHYDQSGANRPRVNAIIFKGKDEEVSRGEEDDIDDFVDFFDGDYRILKGLGAIDSSDYQD